MFWIAVRALILMLFWRWFVTAPDGPFDVPALSYGNTVGITLLLSIALVGGERFARGGPLREQLIGSFIYSALVLAAGVAVHLLRG